MEFGFTVLRPCEKDRLGIRVSVLKNTLHNVNIMAIEEDSLVDQENIRLKNGRVAGHEGPHQSLARGHYHQDQRQDHACGHTT